MGSALSKEQILSVIGDYMEIHKTTDMLPNNHSENNTERFVRLEEGQNRLADRLELTEKRLDNKIDHVEKSLNDKIDNLEKSLNNKIDNLEKSFVLLGSRLDRQDERIERKFNQSIAYSSGFFILITGLMTIYQFLL